MPSIRVVIIGAAAVLAAGIFSMARHEPVQASAVTNYQPENMKDFKKPETAELKKKLTSEQYAVTQQCGTEPAFHNAYWDNHKPGIYVDVVSGEPLFSSLDKFDSGTGWPSFTQPIAGHIATRLDFKLIKPRTEYHCARCGGHQGHVFKDGPPPRGERWCNNGIALNFVPKDEPLPALRS